jgi:bidirectional [NiFe] hydrogenase diaphorase subunit
MATPLFRRTFKDSPKMDLAELQEIAQQERTSIKLVQIRCCVAAGCLSANSQIVKQRLEAAVTDAGLEAQVQVTGVGCMRLCCNGPLVEVQGSNKTENLGTLYEKVTPEDAPSIIAAVEGGETKVQKGDLTQPFFTQQMPIVLENSGKIDPERIQSYIAAEGYQALYHVLREMTSAEVVDTVTRSGLRGRGGAGCITC